MTSRALELEFGDGIYSFRLRFAQIVELQALTGVGPFELSARLSMGYPKFEDIRETIRLGLIGGGVGWIGRTEKEPGVEVKVDPSRAARLVSTYVDTYGDNRHSWAASRLVAQAVIGAGLVGIPGEEVGQKKDQGETAADPNPSPTAESA